MPQEAQLFISYLLTGLANGAVIALIALGYTMVYGIIELINFAHGDVFMLGAFTGLFALGLIGAASSAPGFALVGQLLLVFLAGMAFTAILNVFVERVAYRPLRRAPRLAPLISAIGVSFILQNTGYYWVQFVLGNGAAFKNFPDLIPRWDLLQDGFGITDSLIRFGTKDIFVIFITIPLMIALRAFIQHTRIGKAMRATAQDRDAAALMGIDINQIISMTFLIGGALAGAAGIIYGLYNNTIIFTMGFTAGLKAFTAAVLGGIGNLTGAMLGGFLIGIIAAMSDGYLNTRWTNAVVFAVLVLILVFKPSGLVGERTVDKA